MAGRITRVTEERSGERDIRSDHADGCGKVPADYMPGEVFKSGRVCAGTGMSNGFRVVSCQLCPYVPALLPAEVAPEPELDHIPAERTGVTLDWSDDHARANGMRSHYEGWSNRPVLKPCVHCGGETALRNTAGKPSHKDCQERAGGEVSVSARGKGREHGN